MPKFDIVPLQEAMSKDGPVEYWLAGRRSRSVLRLRLWIRRRRSKKAGRLPGNRFRRKSRA